MNEAGKGAAECYLMDNFSPPEKPCHCTKMYKLIINKYNITVTFGLSYYMILPDEYIPWNQQRSQIDYLIMHHTYFEMLVSMADVTIVNYGVHYDGRVGILHPFTVRYVSSVFRSDMEKNQNKVHFWRATYPQYYNDKLRSGLFIFHDNKTCMERGQFAQRHWTDSSAIGLLQEQGIQSIDYYPVLKSRGDLHNKPAPGRPIGTRLDCTHWCYSKELWSGLWHLINGAIIGNDQSKIKTRMQGKTAMRYKI